MSGPIAFMRLKIKKKSLSGNRKEIHVLKTNYIFFIMMLQQVHISVRNLSNYERNISAGELWHVRSVNVYNDHPPMSPFQTPARPFQLWL
jgi:hypothetical protein